MLFSSYSIETEVLIDQTPSILGLFGILVLPNTAAWHGSGQLEHGFHGVTLFICFTGPEEARLNTDRVYLAVQMVVATLAQESGDLTTTLF
jgi:hypothetical protein